MIKELLLNLTVMIIVVIFILLFPLILPLLALLQKRAAGVTLPLSQDYGPGPIGFVLRFRSYCGFSGDWQCY